MNKKKIGIIATLSIFNIPLSIYLSAIIHTKLAKIEFSQIVVDKQLLLLFFLVYLLVEVIIIMLFGFGSKNVFQSGTVSITDKLKTPEIMGQGQHGTARWLTKKEFRNAFKCNTLSDSDNTFNSGGIIVGYEKNKKSEKIYYIDDNIHSLVVGATRSGKTRSIVLQTVGNIGLAGESMIISDPKAEIYHYTSKFLENLGYKIITLDFKNPTKSTRYNFLQPVIDAVNREDFRKAEEYAWDITQSLVGNEDTKMEKIWRDGEMSVIAGAIMSVVFDNKEHPEYQNLTNVYSFISEMCRTTGQQMPINKYIENLAPEHPASTIFNIARIAPEKTRGSFFTSALTTLRLFTSKSIYGMTCKSDFSLKQAGEEKTATYIILPDEKTTYYPLASLFVYQNYVSLVESADERGGELKTRVNYILDEFGNFTTIPAFSNMLTVAGGRKIRFNLFLQSFSQLENKYGREVAENIRDNCQTWIYLKTASNETASIISKKLGTYTTSSYSRSSSYSKYQNGSNSESINLISRNLLTEDEILRIERPYVLVIQTGLFPIITKLPDISKWKFNSLFGMGSQEHNRKLRFERESQRPVKEIEDIKLWGIWNSYK
jgi:type IV secretion system protein VirD4